MTIDTLNVELTKTKQQLRVTLKNARNADDEFNELLYSSASGLSDSETLIRRGSLEAQAAIESASDSEDPVVLSPSRAVPPKPDEVAARRKVRSGGK
jgi:hypothetical protein